MTHDAPGAPFTRRAVLLCSVLLLSACSKPSQQAPPAQKEGATATMKAVRIHSFGGPEVLKVEDVPRPEPQQGEMLVRVMAAGINPLDAKARGGSLKAIMGDRMPFILGWDVAGVVERVGPGVTRFRAGDALYAFLDRARGGGYGQYAIVKEGEAALKPKSLSFEQAAAMPLAALTAWQALFDTAKLQAGQTVLIQGGSGGVGSFAVQLAKVRGARVIATASTVNQGLLRELGADEAIDYTAERFEQRVHDVDVVMDAVGGETLTRSLEVVKRGGFVVSLVEAPAAAALEPRGLRGVRASVNPNPEQLAEMSALVEAGKLRPEVSRVLPLEQVREAHEQIATHHTRGKIVLSLDARSGARE
jgi:NADPH:quinone reductase-like Zn-dependent oxidoreductase